MMTSDDDLWKVRSKYQIKKDEASGYFIYNKFSFQFFNWKQT